MTLKGIRIGIGFVQKEAICIGPIFDHIETERPWLSRYRGAPVLDKCLEERLTVFRPYPEATDSSKHADPLSITA